MLNLVIKRVWERYMKTFRDHCTTVTVLPSQRSRFWPRVTSLAAYFLPVPPPLLLP